MICKVPLRMEEGVIASWTSHRTMLGGELVEIRTPEYEDRGGAALRKLRKTLRLGTREASEIIGLAASTYSALEAGKLVSPDLDLVAQYLISSQEK